MKVINRSTIFSITCVIVFEIIFNLLAYLKFGNGYLLKDYLYIAVIVWGIMLFFISRALFNKYHRVKNLVFLNADKSKAEENWQKEKKTFIVKTLKIISYVFGAAAPLYLLAYLDNSEVLNSSNIYIPIILFCIAIFSLIAWKLLQWQQDNK